MLETAGAGLDLDARRKIDLRYHELSRAGYYTQLEGAGGAPTLVEPEEILAATTAAPEGTPAAMRGRMIREFAATPEHISAGWCSVVVTKPKVRVVRLTERGA